MKASFSRPWYHSHTWKAYGLSWYFTYIEALGERTIIGNQLNLTVPILDTSKYASPAIWFDCWVEKNLSEFIPVLKSLHKPSQLPRLLRCDRDKVEKVLKQIGVELPPEPVTPTLDLTGGSEKDGDRPRSERPERPELLEPAIKIDPEFKSLIPPLGAEERSQLLANLLASGCRDPLVVWKGHNILLDGHNRYEICTSEGIEFKTVALELPDRNAAHDWIISNQLGRRNLTPEAVSYLRGKRYNSLKAEVKNPEGKNQHSEVRGQNVPQPKTADQLAAEYKVTGRTIKRDAQYASAVDTLAEALGEDVRPSLLSRGVKLTKRDTLKLAKEASVNPEAVRQKLKQLGETKDIQSTTAPFPYQVGEVCLVIASDEPQLRGRGGCWAIVTKVHEYSCDLQLWNGTAELIKPEHLKSMEYTPEQQQQMQSLCHRLLRLRACGNLEPAAHSILSDLGRKKQPSLTPIEEKLLSVLESEYGLKSKPESANEQGMRPDSSHSEEGRASFSSPASSQKVEVNTNDILIAFASNLGCLSPAQLKFVGKAIARLSPERVSEVVEAIGISSEKQAIEIVKAIVLVYPEAIRDLIEEINNDKNSKVNDGNPEN